MYLYALEYIYGYVWTLLYIFIFSQGQQAILLRPWKMMMVHGCANSCTYICIGKIAKEVVVIVVQFFAYFLHLLFIYTRANVFAVKHAKQPFVIPTEMHHFLLFSFLFNSYILASQLHTWMCACYKIPLRFHFSKFLLSTDLSS